jgi:hypothetical protein
VRKLFEAFRIRVEPVVALLRPLVVKFGAKLEDNLMNIAVAAVIAALTVLFGRIFCKMEPPRSSSGSLSPTY